MMSHQGLGQQLVHPTPGGGAQMQGQWRQPLAGQQATPTEVEGVQKLLTRGHDILEYRSGNVLIKG